MKNRKYNLYGFLLLLLGVGLITVGIINGEYADVFQKAVRICLECIGIG